MTESSAHRAAHDFLDRFITANDTGDLEKLGGCFADVFLAGDAGGVRAVPRDAFLAAVPRRQQVFADAGVGHAVLATYEVTELDERYLLVRTEWSAPRADGSLAVELSSSFLLYRGDHTISAVAYLNHRGL